MPRAKRALSKAWQTHGWPRQSAARTSSSGTWIASYRRAKKCSPNRGRSKKLRARSGSEGVCSLPLLAWMEKGIRHDRSVAGRKPDKYNLLQVSLGVFMADRKISRNDPCPCGSGKKFKHCCIGKNIDWTARRAAATRRPFPLSAPRPRTTPSSRLAVLVAFAVVDARLKE